MVGVKLLYICSLLCGLCLQLGQQDQLRKGLAGLPEPRNDYEIVIPEHDGEGSDVQQVPDAVEDQAEVDAQRQAEVDAESE